jgi:hypothetical protein
MPDLPSYGVQHASYLVLDSLPQLLIPSRAHPMIPILTRTCSVCVPSKSHHFQGRYAIPELTGFLVCGVIPRTTGLQILSCDSYEHERTRALSLQGMDAGTPAP